MSSLHKLLHVLAIAPPFIILDDSQPPPLLSGPVILPSMLPQRAEKQATLYKTLAYTHFLSQRVVQRLYQPKLPPSGNRINWSWLNSLSDWQCKFYFRYVQIFHLIYANK